MRIDDTLTIEANRRADYHVANKQARPMTNAERHEARQRRSERKAKQVRKEFYQMERAHGY